MFTVQGPKNVLGLSFGPDARSLYVACTASHRTHALDLDARELRPLAEGSEQFIGEFLAHPNGRWAFGTLAPPKQRSVVVHSPTGTVADFGLAKPWDGLAFSPDGKRAASIGLTSGKPRAGWSAFALFGWTFGTRGPVQQWELRCPPDADPWYVAFAGNDTLITEDRGHEPPVQRDDFRGNTRFSVRDPRTGKARAV